MFYVGLVEAREELLSRHHLRQEVEQWWSEERGFPFPQAFLHERPLGFVSRHLATARYEDILFIRMCEIVGITPVWSTYTGDKFIDRSPVKYSYLQPRVVEGFGKRNVPIVRRFRLADPKAWEGRRLDEIQVVHEKKSLVSYHEERLRSIYSVPRLITLWINDLTFVYKDCEGGAVGYYPLLLSLAIAHGVMFEDFHGGESTSVSLDSFTSRVFEPAFREVSEHFGAPPLIVPLPWWKELGYYPSPELCRAVPWRTHPILRDYRIEG